MTPETAEWGAGPVQVNQEHVRYSAERYDTYTAHCTEQFDKELAKQVIEEATSRPAGATLLDVGTGTARFLVYLAGVEPLKGMHLVGTDLFADMIDRARQTLAETGLSETIELVEDDVHESKLPGGYADIIISRSTIHHWRNPAQALKEIYRLLKPGGVALIHDVRRDAVPEAVAEFNRLRAAAGLGPSVLEEKFTADEVTGFLNAAGLGDFARVYAPKKGLMALGIAVVVRKP